MQKTVAVAVVVFLSAGLAQAQAIGGGVKGGLSSATLTGVPEESGLTSSRRQGLSVGGFVSFRLNDVVSIQPEVSYVQKGINIRNSSLPGSVSMRLAYLEFPVLVRVAPRVRGPVGFDVFGGPAFGARLSARGVAEGTGSNVNVDQDVKDQVKSSEIGMAFGGAVYFGRFLIEARYTLGLTNIALDPEADTNPPKNRAFGLLFGVRF